MRKYLSKVDDNQPEIVKFLRKLGASVQPLHTIGKGCPDIVVGFRGQNWLVEIKDGSKAPSQRRLTTDEGKWRAAWVGQYAVVECTDDCLSLLSIDIRPNSFVLQAQAAREVC